MSRISVAGIQMRVIDNHDSVLTAEEISAGVVLACTTCPEGQVVIDL